MKLDHPSMFAIEHSAGGFGMPDTPTSDEGTYVGPISLHNAIVLRSSKAVHKSTSPMPGWFGSSSPHPRARFPIQLACCDARRLIYLVAVGEVHPG